MFLQTPTQRQDRHFDSTPYFGWLYQWGAPLTLIGANREQIADARRELVRIGVDNVTGSAVGNVSVMANGTPLRSYRVADFGDLAAALQNGPVTVLDVRQEGEYNDSHIPGAINIPRTNSLTGSRRCPHAKCGCTAGPDTEHRSQRPCSISGPGLSCWSTTPSTAQRNSAWPLDARPR